jgi:hypothetical protein
MVLKTVKHCTVKKLLLLATFAFLLTFTYGQKEANFWYFGEYAGLNFGLGVPLAITNGALNTGEGCSSISTGSGNLLFYTDGTTVWNQTHQVMENGTGLHGHSSSTQSGLIVPNPSNPDIYYIFTVDARDNNLFYGLQYSVVDMAANGGLGRVDPTQKNIPLVAPACEKLTAVGNYVGNGFWVITHEWGTNAFYAFEITASGVNATPIISNEGAVISGDYEYSKGYIKVSPDGETLAIAHNTLRLVEIFDFNTVSGEISNPISDYNYENYGGNDPGGPYGVEFSPDSKKLYIGEWKTGRKIFQYNLEAGSPQQILDSRVLVASVAQGTPNIGALQLGPDNRMYIARNNVDHLSRINFPNTLGVGCSFEENAVNLLGRDCRYGLPPFIQSFFNANVEFFWETPACYGDPTQFFLSASVNPDSVFWNFGDYATGDDNFSTDLNPTHLFSDTLLHFVTLTYYLGNNTEVILHTITVRNFPVIDLGNDSAFCYIEPVVLTPGANYQTYLWQDNSTEPTFTVTTSGTYWCEVTNLWGCPDRDTINLIVGQEPVVTVSADATLIPFGTSTGLHGEYTGGNGPFGYQWEPASLVVNPNILEPQTTNLESTTVFTLYVTDESAGCTGEQSVTVYVTGGPLVVTATATPPAVCLGGSTVLNAQPSGGTGDYTYLWTAPGFTSDLQSPTVVPTQTTTYHVVLDDGLSITEDDITVTVNPDPVAHAGDDEIIPYGTTTVLYGSGSVGSGDYTWAWAPSQWLNSTYTNIVTTKNITQTVVFTLVITDNQTGCVSVADSVVVTPEGGPLGVIIESSASPICHGNSCILTAYASGGNSLNQVEFSWEDQYGVQYTPGQSITVSPNATTEFFVTVDDGYNVATSSFIQVIYPGSYFTLAGGLGSITACPYDTVMIEPSPNPEEWIYLWSNGSTEDHLKVGSTGIGYDVKTFTLTTTSPNGCQYSQDITIIFDFGSCFGTEEHAIEPIRIYPNPGNGTFSFEGITREEWSELRIYNVQLQQVHYEKLTSNAHSGNRLRKDLSFLPPGIYFINLSRDGVKATGKLVILP